MKTSKVKMKTMSEEQKKAIFNPTLDVLDKLDGYSNPYEADEDEGDYDVNDMLIKDFIMYYSVSGNNKNITVRYGLDIPVPFDILKTVAYCQVKRCSWGYMENVRVHRIDLFDQFVEFDGEGYYFDDAFEVVKDRLLELGL